MGITNTHKQAAAWEYVKFVTNKTDGVEQVFCRAASRGGRTDVWNVPRAPVYERRMKSTLRAASGIAIAAGCFPV